MPGAGDSGAALVTGANGFIGRAIMDHLRRHRLDGARRAVRQDPPGPDFVATGDLAADGDLATALAGITHIVHAAAARFHVMSGPDRDDLAEFRRVNVQGTERLLRAAAAAGVRRFVFLSSIGVNGQVSGDGPFTEASAPAPAGAYAVSKWEAERMLARVARETAVETVILRPPLVYGPGAKGNFPRLMSIVRRGLPLPLGSVRNRRGLTSAANLAAAAACLAHPAAVGRTYLESDGEDVSTPDQIRRIAAALGRPALLFPCPVWMLRAAATFGPAKQIEQLTGNLYVDSTPLRRELNWTPPASMDGELRRSAEWFRGAGLS